MAANEENETGIRLVIEDPSHSEAPQRSWFCARKLMTEEPI